MIGDDRKNIKSKWWRQNQKMIGKILKNVKSECKNMIGDECGVVKKSWAWREWKKLSVKRVKEVGWWQMYWAADLTQPVWGWQVGCLVSPRGSGGVTFLMAKFE